MQLLNHVYNFDLGYSMFFIINVGGDMMVALFQQSLTMSLRRNIIRFQERE